MKRSRLLQWGAVVAALAVTVTLAVVSPGFEAQDVARTDDAVWVTRASGQYARVNTQTAEIDTVRQVEAPSGVVQAGDTSVVLTQGYGRAWVIDPAQPHDLTPSAAATDTTGVPETRPSDQHGVDGTELSAAGGRANTNAVATPLGTRTVEAAGGRVLFLTETGEALISNADTGTLTSATPIDAFAGERVSAAAMTASGTVVLFAAATGEVRSYDAATGAFTSRATPVSGWHATEPTTPLQLSVIAGDWVLYDPEHAEVWIEDAPAPLPVAVQGRGLLQRTTEAGAAAPGAPGSAAEYALLADDGGLWQLSAGEATRLTEAFGSPTVPAVVAAGNTPSTETNASVSRGTAVAAWISPTSAQLWSATAGHTELALDPTLETLTDPVPVLHSNGSHAVLADERSGMLWTVPGGTLIPLSQWSLSDPPQQEARDTVTQQASEPEPPVAVDDTFGVRAGAPAALPVLLNDFDPNPSDVLTIVTEGLGSDLDPAFGTVAALAHAQELVVQTAPGATGSTTFSYQITDGVFTSAPATVTLNVVSEADNTAPEWCGVPACTRDWPTPEVVPGGTLVLPMLDGWVDPQGDPLRLTAARLVDPAQPARAVITGDGRLAVQHTDPNAADTDLTVLIAVAGSRGETTERELTVAVRSGAAPVFAADAVTVALGQAATLAPLERVSGGSGSYEIIDVVSEHGTAQPTLRAASDTVTVTATEAGGSTLTVTVRDRETEAETVGVVRVTAVETAPPVAMPPLRAYLRPHADTTLDVLAAIPEADLRGLTVRSALVREGAIRTDVIGHETVRIAHTGAESESDRVSTVDLTIDAADGSTLTGRITVYGVPEHDAGGVITVPDAVTVRAGSLTDIAVLDNDIAPPGERLVLHPDITVSTPDDGASERAETLAFASGTQLRYLAPTTPGQYTLTYSAYGAASPEQLDTASVRVTVVEAQPNRAPQPSTLTVRLAAGERAQTIVPLSGIEPDGDRVQLVAADSEGARGLSVAVSAHGASLDVTAAENTPPGLYTLSYTVRNSAGAEGTGVLRVILTNTPAERGAPIAFTDEVRIPVGDTTTTVRPTDNDRDPAGGTLEILSVTPNLPGGSAHPDYAALAQRLDTSDLANGIVRVRGSDTPGVSRYTYTVRSSVSTGTADGIIAVHASARVGAVAPQIRDTVLTAGQRDELRTPGIDVLTGHVTWPGGELSQLQLSVWGAAAERYTATGSRISGTYPDTGDTVPFVVRGVDASGSAIESYGFLFLPALDELRVTLRPGLTPLSVDEEATLTAPLRELVAVGAGDTLQVADGAFTVHREQASCTGTNTTDGGTLNYRAGREAPWNDTCTLRVKLAEQTRFSTVVIPIAVIPDEPAAQLTTVTRTIAPGATETVQLTDLLSWYGNRAGQPSALTWQVDTTAPGFDITRTGTQLTVTAHATATPGTQHALPVRVSGAGDSTATLALRVGIAAPDTPRGATVPLRCTVGTSCEISLVGQPGEYDPFAGAPGGGLTLVSVASGDCRIADLQITGNRVRVNWADPRGPGGLCTVRFTVRDAQQRTGTGTVELDAQGVPAAPASISQIGYGEHSVRLFVSSGPAAQAHPSLTGMVIDIDGAPSNASCTPSGGGHSCLVTGLDTGQQHRFTARAVNTVGESAPTPNAVVAWAYRTPAAPQVEAVQTSAQSAQAATVQFTIDSADRSTGGYRVTVGSRTQEFGVHDRIVVAGVPVGSVNYRVVPLSQYTVPAGDTADGAGVSGSLTLAGLPVVTMQLSSETGSDRVRVALEADANGGTEIRTGVVGGEPGSVPQCAATTNGSSYAGELVGTRNRTLHVVACAENEWGSATAVTQQILVGGELPAPTVRRGFEISPTPTDLGGGIYEYALTTPPQVDTAPAAQLEYQINDVGLGVGTVFPTHLDPSGPTRVQVRQVGAESTSPWVSVPSNVPGSVQISVPGCLPADATPEQLQSLVSAGARPAATVSYVGGTLSVRWSGDYAPLTAFDAVVPACAEPPAPQPLDPPADQPAPP